ncbi:MAG: two-component system sensor histidine kinase CreC [Syntrophorhabdaceae bacterium]|nr:two-component system sensor histidine kinase CreC [Syntrophorhabdaceae bacterium]
MAMAFSGIIWLIISDVRPRYLEAVEESTVETAELMAAVISGQITDDLIPVDKISATMESVGKRQFSARIYNIVKRNVSLRVYVTDAKGILLYDSTGSSSPGENFSRWNDVHLTLKGEYGARSTRTIPHKPSSQVIFVAAPIIKNNEIVGVLSVGKPKDSISFLIDIAQKRFRFSLIMIALAAIALSVGLSYWITRPVRRLTDYADSIRKGEPQRLPALGSSEISMLGAAMEEMQAKLEGKNYIEDYVRALTHELKSPLTGIKGAGEILRDYIADKNGVKFLNIIDAEVGRLHNLVNRMLQLSRLENVRAINRTRFSAGLFCEELADSFQPRLAAKEIDLQCVVQEGISLKGDELLLRQAVGNLVDNAIDFSPRGSAISLSISQTPEGIRITVRDQGVGMQDFALEKAFDKFFSLSRPDTGKKSIGLGLPFVAEVMSLHGGEVLLANTEQGLEATIILPG